MERRLTVDDAIRVRDFLERYVDLCQDFGLMIEGGGLRVSPLHTAETSAYATRNPDHSLSLNYTSQLPEPAPSRIVPRAGRRIWEILADDDGKGRG